MSALTEVVDDFRPDDKKALLFLQINDAERDLAHLLVRLEDLVEERIDYEVIKKDASDIVLVRLMPLEAKEAALLLSETGITKLIVLFPSNRHQMLKTSLRYGEKLKK